MYPERPESAATWVTFDGTRRLPADLFAPAVGVAHLDHRAQHVVPGLLILHHRIGEDAAIPADVAHFLGEITVLVAQPIAGVLHDIEPAVRIVHRHVPSGGRVIARTEGRAV